MQPNQSKMNDNVLAKITTKEMGQFFRAPIAWLFLVAFLLVSLFVFFWVEAFFARNIADVRPLFEWMPLLLIFLSSALTMKMWSEERRSGTLEHVLTQPVALWKFVVGKFLACWALLAIALLLTFPMPITVAMVGDVDWGPVFSGYLAALLLGGAYLSMGLFVSSRCDNQIVSLILSVALAGVFYLVGAGVLTNLFGTATSELMRSLGTGSRFESITRGVVDFRDLYYYISLIAVFIALNIFSLERGRWARDGNAKYHSVWHWTISLVLLNVLFANVWLAQIPTLRWDTTRGDMYSISPATKDYLAQLQEPMLIRGYFSQKTHPLLAPLVPQIQDLMREYEIAGKGRVNVEVVDPTTNPELEDEANNTYNIKSSPFRVNDRHQAAVVNSYFDILIQYGDETQVLSFSDLIEVKMSNETEMEVQLRNPEYDITSAIKKILYAYQSGGKLFDSIDEPIVIKQYISQDDLLPPELITLKQDIADQLSQVKNEAGEKLNIEVIDPDANGGAVGEKIKQEYGFTPMLAGLDKPKPFFFYITIGQGDNLLQLPLGDYSGGAFKTSLDAGLKRFAKGFTKTIAFVGPKELDEQLRSHMRKPPKPTFNTLKEILSNNFNVVEENLADGSVDPSADIVILAAPELADDVELFAVDQFMMRGGTVIIATSPFSVTFGREAFGLENYPNGIADWLEDIGITMANTLVMDKQSSAFPVPVTREVGGMRFQEMRMLDYPYFVDVRDENLSEESLITSGLPQVTVTWPSAITLDDNKLANLDVTPLLYSSSESWLSSDRVIMPSSAQVDYGYPMGDNPQRHLLGVVLKGKFTSAFAGQDSPLIDKGASSNDTAVQSISSVIEQSPDSARLIVISSNDMLRDEIVSMLGGAAGGAYLNNIQLISNTVDWALEDDGLLSIRARGHFNRTLKPMEKSEQKGWEYSNYFMALLGLLCLWLVSRYLHRVRVARYQKWLAA